VFESHIINGTIKPYIEKSKYIVDIGANIGCHSISYAGFNKNCEIWAFEPQEKLFNILKRNIDMNVVRDRVHPYRCAVGHKTCDGTMSSLDKVYDARQMGHNKGGLGIGKGGEPMKMVRLDDMELPGLDFMKIDVEGAEGLVIQGAQETIKKYKPVIFFEHNYQTIRPEDVGLVHVPTPFEELVKLGYTVFRYVGQENYITEP
jgi:FkbM family methyltransferase